MIVQDILDIVKIRSDNIALSKNDNAIIKFIYLGLSELYRIFNLSLKGEAIETNETKVQYELKNEDVSLLLNVYDVDGRELISSDVVEGKHWDYKQLNYRSFLLNHPREGFVYAVYKACPVRISDSRDQLDIPDAMVDALLCYVTYMLQSTVTSGTSVLGRGSTLEAGDYFQKWKAACQELEMQGYKIPIAAETLSIIAKGYR